jgi:hypothetical protein
MVCTLNNASLRCRPALVVMMLVLLNPQMPNSLITTLAN